MKILPTFATKIFNKQFKLLVKMKKLFALFLVAGAITFSSCGGEKPAETSADTTAVAPEATPVDTVATTPADTSAAAPTDSTAGAAH